MSRLAVLVDLAEYSTASTAGCEALKSSLWQLTKLRRKQNRGMLTMEETFHADQIREELRARTVVRDRTEPTLMYDDDDDDHASPRGMTLPEWEKVAVLQARALADKENTASATTTTTASSTTLSGGLRQRMKTGTNDAASELKSTNDKAATTATRTQDPDKNMMVQDPMLDEEEMLLQRDPLDLFAGVRPGDLKLAQKKAEEALDFYIQAANRAAKILEQLNTTSTNKGAATKT